MPINICPLWRSVIGRDIFSVLAPVPDPWQETGYINPLPLFMAVSVIQICDIRVANACGIRDLLNLGGLCLNQLVPYWVLLAAKLTPRWKVNIVRSIEYYWLRIWQHVRRPILLYYWGYWPWIWYHAGRPTVLSTTGRDFDITREDQWNSIC